MAHTTGMKLLKIMSLLLLVGFSGFVWSMSAIAVSAQSVTSLRDSLVRAIDEQDRITALRTIQQIDQMARAGELPTGQDLGEVYRFLAQMAEYTGPPALSVALLEHGLALVKAQDKKDDEAIFRLRSDLTNALLFAGDLSAALQNGEDMAQVLTAMGQVTTDYAFKNQVSLGTAYVMAGQLNAAATAYKQALERTPKKARDPFLDLIATRGLAGSLMQTGSTDEALKLLDRAYDLAVGLHGTESAAALNIRLDQSFGLVAKGDTITAWDLAQNTHSDAMRLLGPAHAITSRAAEFLEAFDTTSQITPAQNQGVTSEAAQLAALQSTAQQAMLKGDANAIESALRAIVEFNRTAADLGVDAYATALDALVQFYSAQTDDTTTAARFLSQTIGTLVQDLGPDHYVTLQFQRIAIMRRISEAEIFQEFYDQYGQDVVERAGLQPKFWDGTEKGAAYNDADIEIFQNYAIALDAADKFADAVIAEVQLAEVLGKVERFNAAALVLSDLRVRLEDKIAQTGTLYIDLRVFVQQAEAQNLSAAGAFPQALAAYASTVPAVFDLLRNVHMTVDGLADTKPLQFGRLFGLGYASTAWLALRADPPLGESMADDAIFEAAQIAGYGPASAAVARSGLRRLMRNPDMAGLANQWREMTRLSSPAPNPVTNDLRSVALDNLRTAIMEKAPEFYDLQVPLPVSVAEIRDRNLLSTDDALIVVLPALEAGSFAGDARIGGLVLAVTATEFAAAPIRLGSSELVTKVVRMHAELDQRPLEQEASLRTETSRAPVNPPVQDPERLAGKARDFSFERGHEVYQAIFGADDIRALIKDKANWIIVAHGMSMSVPFPALITQSPPDPQTPMLQRLRMTNWLGTERALTVVPSVQSWMTLKEREGPPQSGQGALAYLGIGDPAFEGIGAADLTSATEVLTSSYSERHAGVRALPRLPGTRREVERISTLFENDQRSVLLGARASEAEVRNLHRTGELSKIRVLHFATHGLLRGAFDELGEPALALSPPLHPQGDANDGLLTASEAASLDLNADWVILSACDTAGAEVLDGDGLGGLAQGFFSAGAKSLLVSHWRVDDRAAEQLVTRTMQEAQNGVPKSEALRRAMQSLIADTSRDDTPNSFAHPSLWAPFILVGTN